MNPRIEVTVGTKAGEEHEVPSSEEGRSLVVGRDSDCGIRLADTQLSRRHCEFTFEGGYVYVEDLHSRNGTRVRGHRIHDKTELHHGDKVKAGSLVMRVKYVDKEPEHEVAEALLPGKSVAHEQAKRLAKLEEESLAGYELDTRISEDDLTCTFKATRAGSSTPVALRFVKPDAGASAQQEARFLRGAKAASGLDHPVLLKVRDYGRHEHIPFVVTDYVEGSYLHRMLTKAGKPMKVPAAISVCLQLLSALQYVHGKRIVLRSVCPDGMILTPDGSVKITDYELAKHLPEAEKTEVTQVLDEDLQVDPRFAAPELIVRPFLADQRADIFGAGACLYFMLTAKAPFPSSLPNGLPAHAFKRKLTDPCTLNRRIPKSVRAIILTAMSDHLDKRYQTVERMKRALERAAESA